ncbi:hypothetical protein FOYG_15620 [Fusarium oxysporum NRRL 32931]|uniref:Uncharacterized protein n=1 Tax=Fusarium oxysporum NRRL 32931 TaxID=660029 RepID=W9HMD2_FUSOX|nr:hypothetical protein FOYG_15620 [Fusarium oxysporum NRRL 32931]
MTANETVKSRYIEPLDAESVWCVGYDSAQRNVAVGQELWAL